MAYELEFFRHASGHEPALDWIKELSPIKRRALTAALEQILQVDGINVCSTEYGKNLGQGLFEFRLRKNLDQILGRGRHTEGEEEVDKKKKKKGERVLLRVFCHAYGNKKILLISGYDKGKDRAKGANSRRSPLLGSCSHNSRDSPAGLNWLLTRLWVIAHNSAWRSGVMGTRFRDYVRSVEEEAAAEGAAAVRELADFRTHFRLAQQLVELRRKLKLSQQALAARSGIHQTEISRIEKGLANPTVRTLAALAESLKADLWLRPRDGKRLSAGRRPRRAA